MIDSRRSEFMARARALMALGVDDAVQQAKRNLGGSGALTNSVRAERTGLETWRIGSDHPGALAQERGAYLRPRGRRALRFAGRFSAHARIKPKRWLRRAGRRMPYLITARLKKGY